MHAAHAIRAGLILLAGTLLAVSPVRADDDKKPAEIAVRAVGLDGKPIAGAQVTVFKFDTDWRTWKPITDAASTDSQGTVRFERLAGDSFLVVARAGQEELGFKDAILSEEGRKLEMEIVLARPVVATLRLRDAAGKPIVGASIHGMRFTDPNGTVSLPGVSLAGLGFANNKSDKTGVLKLPALPSGAEVKVKLVHAEAAPIDVKHVVIRDAATTEVVMTPGVPVTVEVHPAELAVKAGKLKLDLRHEPYEAPSTLIGTHVALDSNGKGSITVGEGEFHWFRCEHPAFVIAPIYTGYANGQANPFRIAKGRDQFQFEIRPKVRVRGRVINGATGKPPADVAVSGAVKSPKITGPLAEHVMEWTHVDWVDVDKEGRFEIKLAAGPARLGVLAEGFVVTNDKLEIDVAPDGSTIAPDLVVLPMPKVQGVVKLPDGKPAARAVVRFGWNLRTEKPVMCDESGRFELSPSWMPVDWKTEEAKPRQPLIAFHPFEPLGARMDISLDKPDTLKSLVLVLEPRDYQQTLNDSQDEDDLAKRTANSTESKSASSAEAKSVPSINGMTWLNTDKPALDWEDFRGKYVLLDFWTTWCGPCHADFPSVRMVYELYKDKGLVVVGVHDNSMPLEAIRADALKEKLTFPIVVDHQDGRLLKRYENLVHGFPTYLLIGPDGTIVHEDHTSSGAYLRVHKIEMIRALLMGSKSASR